MTDVQFVDLQAQRARIGSGMDEAIARVLAHGHYIMGPEVEALERALAEYVGCAQVVTCSSGTDALVMALMALGVGRGDAVVVPTFTFAATAEAVAFLGATPVFVDVREDTYNLDASALDSACEVARAEGLRPAAVIPVDLFGQPADYDALARVAGALGLRVVADAAQSFGGEWQGRRVGTLADLTTTSFFPAKPLGCYGDGGAIFTDDAGFADVMRSVRVHGQGAHKYENVRVGINGRLDTMQAAVLLEKLRVFPDELSARQEIADRYTRLLEGCVTTPCVAPGASSAWAQYTVRVRDRERVASALRERGIPTAVYYPVPLHLQPAYREFPRAEPTLAVSERLAGEVLSLPMHPYLGQADQARVADGVRAALG